MAVQSLDGEWQVCKAGAQDAFPAVVPGCIHTDLHAAGVIPDPFFGDNERRVAWVAETDWTYTRTFDAEAELLGSEQIFLQCDGLDTVATIRLNGEEIARTDNMHRRHEIEVTECLHARGNVLEIEFASPVNHAKSLAAEGLVITPGDSIFGSPYLRKAPYQWGWDWAPKVPTSGIWRGIRLAGYSVARIEDARIRQVHEDSRVKLDVQVPITRFSEGELAVTGKLISPDGDIIEQTAYIPANEQSASLEFTVEYPQLWWPNGYGGQPLYTLEISLNHQPSTIQPSPINHQPSPISHQPSPIDHSSRRIGLRTVELRQEDDEWGRSFYFEVNGVPIFCKGANWIPADQFPSRITDDRYRDLIASAADAHMNMLRIWGGGIYEDDRFYDLCDEYGILIWQDFMFSCGHYPVTEGFLANVRLEAVDNIRRIRHHPCLALMCGNNEMEWGVCDWWPADKEDRQKEYAQIFYELLPEVCGDECPEFTYWPSSPCSCAPFVTPNGETEGDGHYWDVWHGRKPFTEYRNYHFRFMSEFGFQSLPSMQTIREFAEPEDWNITSYIMESHQKHSAATGLILYYFSHTFRFPKSFEMMTYAGQALQSEAIRYGVEHWRRSRNGNRCMGTLYWQLNDCWPVASWSSIEYNGNWKALHYAARRFYSPVLLSVEETESSARLHITNDTLEPFTGTVRWSLEKLDGTRLMDGEIEASVPAETDLQVAELDFSDRLDHDTRRDTVLVHELLSDGKVVSHGIVTFVPNKHLELPEADISAEVRDKDEGIEIILTSHETARFVRLEVPGVNVRFSDNYFDLPVRRTAVVKIDAPSDLTPDQVAGNLKVTSLRDSF